MGVKYRNGGMVNRFAATYAHAPHEDADQDRVCDCQQHQHQHHQHMPRRGLHGYDCTSPPTAADTRRSNCSTAPRTVGKGTVTRPARRWELISSRRVGTGRRATHTHTHTHKHTQRRTGQLEQWRDSHVRKPDDLSQFIIYINIFIKQKNLAQKHICYCLL